MIAVGPTSPTEIISTNHQTPILDCKLSEDSETLYAMSKNAVSIALFRSVDMRLDLPKTHKIFCAKKMADQALRTEVSRKITPIRSL